MDRGRAPNGIGHLMILQIFPISSQNSVNKNKLIIELFKQDGDTIKQIWVKFGSTYFICSGSQIPCCHVTARDDVAHSVNNTWMSRHIASRRVALRIV